MWYVEKSVKLLKTKIFAHSIKKFFNYNIWAAGFNINDICITRKTNINYTNNTTKTKYRVRQNNLPNFECEYKPLFFLQHTFFCILFLFYDKGSFFNMVLKMSSDKWWLWLSMHCCEGAFWSSERLSLERSGVNSTPVDPAAQGGGVPI